MEYLDFQSRFFENFAKGIDNFIQSFQINILFPFLIPFKALAPSVLIDLIL